jgi:hypothetical protein
MAFGLYGIDHIDPCIHFWEHFTLALPMPMPSKISCNASVPLVVRVVRRETLASEANHNPIGQCSLHRNASRKKWHYSIGKEQPHLCASSQPWCTAVEIEVSDKNVWFPL